MCMFCCHLNMYSLLDEHMVCLHVCIYAQVSPFMNKSWRWTALTLMLQVVDNSRELSSQLYKDAVGGIEPMTLCTVSLCYRASIYTPLEDVGFFFYSVTVGGFLAEVKALVLLGWQVMNLCPLA